MLGGPVFGHCVLFYNQVYSVCPLSVMNNKITAASGEMIIQIVIQVFVYSPLYMDCTFYSLLFTPRKKELSEIESFCFAVQVHVQMWNIIKLRQNKQHSYRETLDWIDA